MEIDDMSTETIRKYLETREAKEKEVATDLPIEDGLFTGRRRTITNTERYTYLIMNSRVYEFSCAGWYVASYDKSYAHNHIRLKKKHGHSFEHVQLMTWGRTR